MFNCPVSLKMMIKMTRLGQTWLQSTEKPGCHKIESMHTRIQGFSSHSIIWFIYCNLFNPIYEYMNIYTQDMSIYKFLFLSIQLHQSGNMHNITYLHLGNIMCMLPSLFQ